jgi:hypothetical protein
MARRGFPLMETKEIRFTANWVDPVTGKSYVVGDVAVFDLTTANKLIAEGKGATSEDPT